MKKTVLILLALLCLNNDLFSQDRTKIERTALDYIEGFYEGDTTKLKRCLHPNLSKNGYGFDEKAKLYNDHPMNYEGAIEFALEVASNPEWAAPKDAAKKIVILDAQDKIACVKLTVYWGVDYLLMAKYGDNWMITKVLWQEVE